MSKYKTGDKFEIEIKEVVVSECGKALYAVEDVPILILDDYILNRLKQVKTEEVETEPDWTKVSVDTPILVRNSAGQPWQMVYFAGRKDGKVSAWYGGRTSWNESMITSWNYAKLAEVE